MKVVLFCGGLGMRLRDFSERVPKPLVPIGGRPILWNLMSYYAHYGHREFILCLGHQAEAIKSYFLNYDQRLTNDFVLRKGGTDIELLGRDIDDWSITFVDTGLNANIGMRLVAIRQHLDGDAVFMANYADGLTDLPLDDYLLHFEHQRKVGSLLSVPAPQTFHLVRTDGENRVCRIEHVSRSTLRMNGGFFVFRQEIFDYIGAGEELVREPFERLVQAGELVAYPYDGFWLAMDTFKDRQRFEELLQSGDAPWQVWKR